MTRRASTYLLAGTLLLPSACQRSKTTLFMGEYAVAIPTQTGEDYAVVPDHGLTSTELAGDVLHPLADVGPPGGAPVTVKLDFTVEHRRVITTVYLLPPESDPLRYSDGHKRRLGVHSARLNETVELKELETVGYQPLALRIVSAKPDHLIHPVIVNNVPSIQARVVDQDRNGCTLLLRNISSRTVVSYSIAESHDSLLSHFSSRQPLIAPRGERVERIQPVSTVVIAAALFGDGSHEGESDAAAQLQSGKIGYEAQESRAIPIIARIIRDAAIDDVVRLARIKDELAKLSNEPDDRVIQTMQSQFPDLPPGVVWKDLTEALYSAKWNLWSEVYGYVHSSGQYPPPIHPPPLSEWLGQRR